MKTKSVHCNICNRNFHENYLEKHKETHDNKRPKFKCDVCSIEVYNLETHQRVHNESRTIYKCGTCAKEFKDKRSMIEHEFNHDNSRQRFPCEVCNKEVYNVKLHKKMVHTESQMMKCDKCPREYRYKHGLSFHM